jgi:hypothetical protein
MNAGRTPEPGIEMVVFSMRSVLSSRLPLGITLPVRGIFHNGSYPHYHEAAIGDGRLVAVFL